MISKQQQKYVQSLHNKKYRNEFKQFLVEGEKAIMELLDSKFKIDKLYCSKTLKSKIELNHKNIDIILATEEELQSISTFKTNKVGIAVVHQIDFEPTTLAKNKIGLILDNINDPGNLGTIIRLADWYGISEIICSKETVDFYNPKVISSTMGSFCRVNCVYCNIETFLKNTETTIYGAFLEGTNIHNQNFESSFYFVIGSESHGISESISKLITQKITIPRIGKAESLNAGIATAIILDNIFRAI
jgi:RNA methyltransferase, TrmH family